jgi:glutathione peroxidase
MVKLKKIAVYSAVIVIVLTAYVLIVTKNLPNMTPKQKILKAFYPALMFATKLFGANTKVLTGSAAPTTAIYDVATILNNGTPLNLNQYKGKHILIVNTASNCGYTNQYTNLQTLQTQNANNLVILAFPANDFKQQEKDDDATIANFCKLNYGVTFPVMQKSVVINATNQNPIYQWLSNPTKNGWCAQQPSWNFAKYLINPQGNLTHYFDPSIDPLSPEITQALNP